MIDHSLDEFIFQLTEAHSEINRLLFNGELQKIKISVERPNRSDSNVLAFHQAGGNLYNGDEGIITIKTKALNGNYKKLMNTLVHEMIHQYCTERGLPTTYCTNPRHNKNFRDAGIKIGWGYLKPSELSPEAAAARKRYGFSEPDYYTDRYLETIDHLSIDQELIKSFVHDDARMTISDTKLFNVYQCPGCEVVIRNQGKLNLMCLDCNQKFKKIK